MGIIYIFTFPNGKKYVGQTVNAKMRYAQHRQKDPHMIVSHAIGKYGWVNIKKQELFYPEEHLDRMEQEWIEKLNCISPNGYNIESGGYHGHRMLSEQTRKKLSEAARGRKFSEEHKRKLSESGRGKHGGEKNGMFGKRRPEHSLRMMGNLNPMFGTNHSESAKRKIAEAAKGRHHTEESKRKMSESWRNRKRIDYSRMAGKGNPMYGRTHSEEAKRKMSEARRRISLCRI